MKNYELELKESISQQKILYYALVGGVVLLGLLALVINTVVGIDFKIDLPSELQYLAIAYIVFTFFISGYVFKQRLSKVDAAMSLVEKVGEYRSAAIIKYAIVEGASLLLATAYLVTGSYVYFILFGVTVGYFLYVRPTKEEMIDELNLSYADQQKLGFE